MKTALPTRFDFSQSSLQDYLDCPRRFRLRYVEQMPWPAVEAALSKEQESRQQEGILFHRLIHQHILGIPAVNLIPSGASPDLLRWWGNYMSADLRLDGHTWRSEVSLFCRVGEHRLVAKYDLIATKDGRAVIYDWKTYMRRPREEWLAARWQTRIYSAVLVRAGAILNAGAPFHPDDVKMVYWFSEFPREPAVFNYDGRRFAADWADIDKLISVISADRSFPLTDDRRMCGACVYRSYCDRGERAAGSSETLEVEPSAAAVYAGLEQTEEMAL